MYLFHSVPFGVFAAAVFALHWALPARGRNALLLAASGAFYASWDWRFLPLLLVSALADYVFALRLAAAGDDRSRRGWLWASVAANVGLLVFYKVGPLFAEAAADLVRAAQAGGGSSVTWRFVLPLGVSFYTLQKLGYVIDVYRRAVEPERDPVDYLLFVSFFPQLIAGPIERASRLLPQLKAARRLADVRWSEGIYLFAWGLFKKVVVADSVGRIADAAFAAGAPPADGAGVLIGLYAYALQLYGDFSGYSDMARGLARFFGIGLSVNFLTPFFAKNFFDFYRRWHITLCDWIADYVYMPLFFGLPRHEPLRRVASSAARLFGSAVLAMLVTRLLFAFWHGVTVPYFLFGLFIFVAQAATGALRPAGRLVPWPERGPLRALAEAGRIAVMFHLFCLAMLFFRSTDAAQVLSLGRTLFAGVDPAGLLRPEHWRLYVCAAFVGAHEYVQYRRGDDLYLTRAGFFAQWTFYAGLVVLGVNVGARADGRFLYFQF